MTRLGLFALCVIACLGAGRAGAQSTEDIVKGLQRPIISPQPGFKGLPFGEKGVQIVEPQDEKPPSIDLNIPFEYNSALLTPDAYRTLRRLGEALKDQRLSSDRFKIAGHTDAKGTAEYNQKLSEQRAQAVRNYLINQYDVEASRIDAVGYGKTQLADPAHPEDGINRRVQVINIGSVSTSSR
jgi:outer membrane protein OmpA-like peptidoglycan-associated protein